MQGGQSHARGRKNSDVVQLVPTEVSDFFERQQGESSRTSAARQWTAVFRKKVDRPGRTLRPFVREKSLQFCHTLGEA